MLQSSSESTLGKMPRWWKSSVAAHLSLRSLFCLFLSCCFTQVLLYIHSVYNPRSLQCALIRACALIRLIPGCFVKPELRQEIDRHTYSRIFCFLWEIGRSRSVYHHNTDRDTITCQDDDWRLGCPSVTVGLNKYTLSLISLRKGTFLCCTFLCYNWWYCLTKTFVKVLVSTKNSFGPPIQILLLIIFAEMPLINAHADMSSGTSLRSELWSKSSSTSILVYAAKALQV